MVAIGLILGPFNHYWYAILDKVVKGSGGQVVLKKIALDQAFAGPFFCTLFLTGKVNLKFQFSELYALRLIQQIEKNSSTLFSAVGLA